MQKVMSLTVPECSHPEGYKDICVTAILSVREATKLYLFLV